MLGLLSSDMMHISNSPVSITPFTSHVLGTELIGYHIPPESPTPESPLLIGYDEAGGGFTTLNYTIHKKRQKCSVKQCNSV